MQQASVGDHERFSTSNVQPNILISETSTTFPKPASATVFFSKRGKMTRIRMLFLIAASLVSAAFAIPAPAHAQPGYGARVTCSSNNGKRNWCDIGNSRDVQLVRQISGSPCVRGSTWGIDQRGLWVDQGCRADFRVR
jgi:hypothetical protein